MATMDSTPSPMACETGSLDTFSLVDAASSTGDDFLMLDTLRSNSAQPTGPVDSLLMDPMLQDFQNTVSRLGPNQPTQEATPGAQTSPSSTVAIGTDGGGSSALPRGFVKATQPGSQDTLTTLEKELFGLVPDKAAWWTEVAFDWVWRYLLDGLDGAFVGDLCHR